MAQLAEQLTLNQRVRVRVPDGVSPPSRPFRGDVPGGPFVISGRPRDAGARATPASTVAVPRSAGCALPSRWRVLKPRPPSSWSAPRVRAQPRDRCRQRLDLARPAGRQSDEATSLRALAGWTPSPGAARCRRTRPRLRGRRPRGPTASSPTTGSRRTQAATSRSTRCCVQPPSRAPGHVLEMLKSDYRCQNDRRLPGLEADGIFLEGTGAMVLDHVSRVAYMAVSHRADTHVLERFCKATSTTSRWPSGRSMPTAVPVYHQRHGVRRHRRRRCSPST